MGVLSELVVALPDDAELVAQSTSPSRDWSGFEWKGLDQIILSSLWVIILGEPVEMENVGDRTDEFQTLCEASEDGPWVYLVPQSLMQLLADLSRASDKSISIVSQLWSTTDELKDWKPSEVSELLQSVIDLADTAELEKKSMLLWICL